MDFIYAWSYFAVWGHLIASNIADLNTVRFLLASMSFATVTIVILICFCHYYEYFLTSWLFKMKMLNEHIVGVLALCYNYVWSHLSKAIIVAFQIHTTTKN